MSDYLNRAECDEKLSTLFTTEQKLRYLHRFTPIGSAFVIGKSQANDFDILILGDRERLSVALLTKGLVYENQDHYDIHAGNFISFRSDQWNLLITQDPGFYERFHRGMDLCRALNLTSRDDRILLVKAIRDNEFPAF